MYAAYLRLRTSNWWGVRRENELFPETHAYLSVVLNCSKFYPVCTDSTVSSPPPTLVCPGIGETAGRVEGVSSSSGWGSTGNTQGERIWSSLDDRKFCMGFFKYIFSGCTLPQLPHFSAWEVPCPLSSSWDSSLMYGENTKPKIQGGHRFADLTIYHL